MTEQYTIEEGDGVTSVAAMRGFFPQTVWDHPANAKLKAQREDMDILLPGDTLTIPDKGLRHEACALDKRHRFKRKGVPASFRLQVLAHGQPVPNRDYLLVLDGTKHRGKTSGEGFIERFLPAACKEAMLLVDWSETERPLMYRLRFGSLDPISDLHGVKKRLANLGFDCGPMHGDMNEETRCALQAFQKLNRLPLTGEADDATKQRLRQIHDKA